MPRRGGEGPHGSCAVASAGESRLEGGAGRGGRAWGIDRDPRMLARERERETCRRLLANGGRGNNGLRGGVEHPRGGERRARVARGDPPEPPEMEEPPELASIEASGVNLVVAVVGSRGAVLVLAVVGAAAQAGEGASAPGRTKGRMSEKEGHQIWGLGLEPAGMGL